MIHYLTETKPYLYNSWPWVYSTEVFAQKLLRAEKEIDALPVIVIQKFNTLGSFSDQDKEYFSEKKDKTFIFNPYTVKLMKDFIDLHQYEIVWSNNFFDILCSKIIR